MLELRELTMQSVLLRILAAVLLSGVMGMERELKNRAAGCRTYMLVSMGACIVMMTNQYIYQLFGVGDPVRMGAQVVSGIGFLGAGTIIVTRHSQIKGLTTAAGLWTSACMGLALGIGFYEVAVVGTVAAVLILSVVHAWEDFIRRNIRVLVIYVELKPEYTLADFIRQSRTAELSLSNIQMEYGGHGNGVSFLVTVTGRKKAGRLEILERLQRIDCIQHTEEL